MNRKRPRSDLTISNHARARDHAPDPGVIGGAGRDHEHDHDQEQESARRQSIECSAEFLRVMTPAATPRCVIVMNDVERRGD
jgi:hypothetical protein